ncbi:MAG TPA: hypothetical protein PK265_03165 [Candidatus Saccharibacteria bacterium]|nr:hypothetical protein [Candidatus Saccharibacteria bacterium]
MSEDGCTTSINLPDCRFSTIELFVTEVTGVGVGELGAGADDGAGVEFGLVAGVVFSSTLGFAEAGESGLAVVGLISEFTALSSSSKSNSFTI